MLIYLFVLFCISFVNATTCRADIENTDELAKRIRYYDGVRGGFDEKIVSQLEPEVSLLSTNTLTTNKYIVTGSNGGTTFSDRYAMATAEVLGFQGAVASIQSRSIVSVQAGQSSVVRFDARFDNPQSGALMLAGLISISDGIGVGYINNNFGVFNYAYGRSDFQQLLITDTGNTGDVIEVTIDTFVANVTLTDVDTAAHCRDVVNALRALPGFDGSFSITQEENFVSVLGRNTVSYGDYSIRVITAGSTFDALWIRRQEAQAATFDWQFSLNGENVTSVNTSKLFSYEIVYGMSGFSNLYIRYFNKDQNLWSLLHDFGTNGPDTFPRSLDANFRVGFVTQWFGQTTTLGSLPSVRGRSMFGANVGPILYNGYEYTQRGSVDVANGMGALGMTCIKMRSTFDGSRYTGVVRIVGIAASSTVQNSTVAVILRRNPDAIADVIWEYETSSESVMLVSRSFGTISGGEPVDILPLAPNSNGEITFEGSSIVRMYPEDEFCLTSTVDGYGSGMTTGKIAWRENQ